MGTAGAGGLDPGDPACPAWQPVAGEDCEPVPDPGWLVCEYGEANCTCPPTGPNAAIWVCNSCPALRPFDGSECLGRFGLSCDYDSAVCDCEGVGLEAIWNCS